MTVHCPTVLETEASGAVSAYVPGLPVYAAQRISDGRRVVVSTDGGVRPLWTREGFVYKSRGRLIRATVAADAQALRVTQLTPVTELRDRSVVGLAPDGRLLLHETAGAPASRGVVSLEWVRDVRSRLGPAVSMSR